ncbi:MAG TPA: helix-hairpin-helix domain-containing protein [Gemmatimonadales bacterium]|nr:helix-hairpin-helix domain-containing protein [Gemmatimonadales bacterium]
MFTHDERRALVFLAVVSAAGAAFRALRPGEQPQVGLSAVAPALAGGDIVRQAAQSQRAEALARPLGPLERVDVDRAPADEVQRLPRIGPALARRIVAEREAHGPFGSLAGLRRVTGIGPGLLRGLEPHVTFGGVAPAAVERDGWPVGAPVGGTGYGAVPSAGDGSGSAAVWVATSAARSAPGAPKAGGCVRAPDLNRAPAADLVCLPGIGAVLAARIVAERTAHGPFRDIADLARVPGLGRVRAERLRGLVTIP